MANTMISSTIQKMTLAEFLVMPETKPVNEFIDGAIHQKPMPQGKHSIIQRELTFTVDRPLRDRKIARAFPELRCTFGDRSTVPDISVILWERIPRHADGTVANTFAIAPDWTIEILSLNQSQTKVVRNILHCLTNGTEMGWLIDLEERSVFVYFADRPAAIFENPSVQIPVPAFVNTGDVIEIDTRTDEFKKRV